MNLDYTVGTFPSSSSAPGKEASTQPKRSVWLRRDCFGGARGEAGNEAIETERFRITIAIA